MLRQGGPQDRIACQFGGRPRHYHIVAGNLIGRENLGAKILPYQAFYAVAIYRPPQLLLRNRQAQSRTILLRFWCRTNDRQHSEVTIRRALCTLEYATIIGGPQ